MTLRETELDEILGEAVSAAEDAGALLIRGLDKPKKVDLKGDVDLVTEYDKRAEGLITKRLVSRFPEFTVLAEESGVSPGRETAVRWIVDPLDGTTNFAHGHPMFSVSIGLEERGRLVAGTVVIPVLGLTFQARSGGGAFCNGQPIKVSTQDTVEEALIATGFPYDRRTSDDNNVREWAAFIQRAQGNRRCGSAAIDLAFVARGIYDGFYEPKLSAWDIAAGIVLVREAGGRVTDYEDEPIDPFKGWIVASNGLIHTEMLSIIREARRSMTRTDDQT